MMGSGDCENAYWCYGIDQAPVSDSQNVRSMNMDQLIDKFQPERLGIKEFDHWLLTVRSKQVTLGCVVLILKRTEPSLAGLLPDELLELPKAFHWFEDSAKRLFQAEKFNYIAAMMKDPLVHFHGLPRYSSERQFAGSQWLDKFYPKVATLEDVATTDSDLDALVHAYRGGV
jgi:diadenosine tetraphosphate (Ap4A) HIT family hydrolase